MAKPESWRFNPASYPVTLECETRFQDIDINGHLNNVAFAALFENARVRLNHDAGIREHRSADQRTLVAAVEINYLGEGRFMKPVMIASGVGHIGTSSWQVVQAMFQNGQCIATCDTIIVSREFGAAKALPVEMRAGLETISAVPVAL